MPFSLLDSVCNGHPCVLIDLFEGICFDVEFFYLGECSLSVCKLFVTIGIKIDICLVWMSFGRRKEFSIHERLKLVMNLHILLCFHRAKSF